MISSKLLRRSILPVKDGAEFTIGSQPRWWSGSTSLCARSSAVKVRALLSKLRLGMPQITRLIRRYHADGELAVQRSSRKRFTGKYTVKDLELLIEVDRAHQQLSGPATRRIVEREWSVFGKREYANLALRHSVGYRQRAAEFTQTKPSGIANRPPISVPRPGPALGQRFGIRQSSVVSIAEETSRGVHPLAPEPQFRQSSGGGENTER